MIFRVWNQIDVLLGPQPFRMADPVPAINPGLEQKTQLPMG